jgi:hypothetical protein
MQTLAQPATTATTTLTTLSAGADLPAGYADAIKALAECDRIDECQDWADRAAALASYARQAKDETLLNYATRIKARASRRCGELAKQIEPKRGANQNIEADGRPKVGRLAEANGAGLSVHQLKQSISVANVPSEDFERQVESETPPTVTALADQGRRCYPYRIRNRKHDPRRVIGGTASEIFSSISTFETLVEQLFGGTRRALRAAAITAAEATEWATDLTQSLEPITRLRDCLIQHAKDMSGTSTEDSPPQNETPAEVTTTSAGATFHAHRQETKHGHRARAMRRDAT